MDSSQPTVGDTGSSMLVYRGRDGNTKIDVELTNGSLWLSQSTIADLYGTTRQNVSAHIGNIFAEEELEPEQTTRSIVQQRLEGTRNVRRTITLYNLDVIVSVGYRVTSKIATQFRQWATERLVEYMVKGFTMDDERLKNPKAFGVDYFDELTKRIREIRASEKRFYQKVRDIFATSIDYDKNDETARRFFQQVQNKLLYSVTGFTAAELIHSRADRSKVNMGLQSWEGARVRRGDIAIGKNYLNEDEVDQLDRLVEQYLVFAEARAARRLPTTMREWASRLDTLLELNEREILQDFGSISMKVAEATAFSEYEAFDAARREREALAADEEDIAALAEYVSSLPDQELI
ncbi:MAG: virulence RhuM family protein [Thermomicrobiales bacterium]|nr:virulence RhuM family protein [Thermomicrobiales bacterium]MCO5229461.1 virulence RhuM family protein [Thermomicrobiales bacterium]